jgi:hypothetical protein
VHDPEPLEAQSGFCHQRDPGWSVSLISIQVLFATAVRW